MSPEGVFALSMGFTLAASFAAGWWVRRPLLSALTDLCGREDRGQIWTILAQLLLFTIPLTICLFTFTRERNSDPWLFQVAVQVRWSMLGLIAAVGGVGAIVLACQAPRDFPLRRADLDDLKRLLDAVRQVRAQQVIEDAVRHAGPQSSASTVLDTLPAPPPKERAREETFLSRSKS